MTKATCTIRFDGSRYYIGLGCCRSKTEFKTFKGACRTAADRGYTNETLTDPREEYLANQNKTKIVTNLLSGKLCRIGVNTPYSCDPSSETYWSA